jgi:hypothetical protein
MESIFESIIPFVVLIFGVGFVLAARRGRNKKYPVEEGATPLFTENLGGALANFKSSPPGIRVSVYPEFVIIAYWGGPMVLRKGDVAKNRNEALVLVRSTDPYQTQATLYLAHIYLNAKYKSGLDAALRKCLLDEPDHPPDEGTRNS